MKINKSSYLALIAATFCIWACVHEELREKNAAIDFSVSVRDISGTPSLLGEKEFKVDGNSLYLSVSESAYTDSCIRTKGAPVTDSDIKTAGQKFRIAAFDHDNPATLYDSTTLTRGASDWSTGKNIIWPEAPKSSITSLDLWAFRNSTEVTSYSWDSGKMSFTYTSGASDAENTSDILFAASPGQSYPATVDLTFYHALSAIAFDVKTLDSEWLSVKSVSITNLYGTGCCSFDPSQTASSSKFIWSSLSGKKTYTQTLDPELESNQSPEKKYTFFVVPQSIGDDATLTVVFQNTKGTTNTFSKKLNTLGTATFLPGKIYTYNISGGGEMSVKLRYNKDASDADASNNFTVENNGFVKAYVRAAVVGNWIGNNSSADNYGKITAMWTEESSLAPGTDWVRGADGFYYYTKPLYSSFSTETGKVMITPSLFDQSSFAASLSSGAAGTSLNISCSVQSVRYDSSKKYITAAWGSTAAGYVSTAD